VQETFLAALEKLADFKGQSSERTWLTAILKYKIIDVYRKRNASWLTTIAAHDAEPEFFEADSGHWTEAMAPRPMATDNTDPTLRKRTGGHPAKMPPAPAGLWQSIFSMKHMDDFATETICRELKITPANFWVIIHRAKVNLRACIQKEGG